MIFGSVLYQDTEVKKILPDSLDFYEPVAYPMRRAGREYWNYKEDSIDGSVLTGMLLYRHHHLEGY